MPLREHDSLGPYEIIEPIGKGGMGEVYRARDPRMGRDVAIKIASEGFSERFTREVHAIAALNHPNVCTLHDVGPDYLVMELVEGPTLADRLAEGPIPLDEALAIARQICDALEAAHDRGIVHRDLKPGNIKLRHDGTVKVLDFGLAKVGGTPTAQSDESPTLSMHATQAGIILGTAAYMAPEQARGKAIDKRVDIWAFGVVLHEMLTGRRLFQGEDLTDTIAAVVREQPDISDAPAPVRRVLEKCLEKDPRKRLRDITGVGLLLESARAETPVSPKAGRDRSRSLLWTLAALATAALVALAAVAFVHFRETPLALQAIEFGMEPPPDNMFTFVYGGYAPSPDGRYVVFAAGPGGLSTTTSRLWLRSLDSVTARPLPGTEAGVFPAWSPDSRSLVFLAGNTLKRIEIAGGSPHTLADAPNAPVTPTAAWSREGVILFGGTAGLKRVSASGGPATLLTKVDSRGKEAGHGYPQFLDSNRFLYFVSSPDPNVQGVYVSSLDHPEQRTLILRTAAKAVFVPSRASYPGYLLWLQDQTLFAQRFNPDTAERIGDPASIAEDIGLNPTAPMRASFWASESGVLVYFSNPPGTKRPLVWVGRDGKPQGDAVPEDSFTNPALSPDGSRVALSRSVGQGTSQRSVNIWIWEFARQTMTRLTFASKSDISPVWSPDGSRVAFGSERDGGVSNVHIKDASGAGEESVLIDDHKARIPLDWSRDGRYVLVRERGRGSDWDLTAITLDAKPQSIPLVTTPFNEGLGRISPDGAWLAYRSDETGRDEIFIQAFPTPGKDGRPLGKWQITNAGASDVVWRADGRELYCESLDGRILAAEIQAGPKGIQAQTPRELFPANTDVTILHSFDATADGQRFLALLTPRTGASSARLTVVANWQATVRR